VVITDVLVITAFRFFGERNRKIYEMWGEVNELQVLQEDYRCRDPAEFLEDAAIRGAADDATAKFQ
jgi:hypothetical protein